MNEELKAKANEVLLKLLDSAEIMAGLTMDKAPLVLQEIVMWGIVSNSIWVLVGVSLAVIGYILYVKGKDIYEKEEGVLYTEEWYYVFFFASCVLIISSPILILHNIEPLLKALFAPTLYLIEYARGLV